MKSQRLSRGIARGQALVEFALVFPVFFFVILAVIDGGRAIFAYNQMSQATRNVARVASVNCFATTTRCDSSTAGSPIAVAIATQGAGQMGPVTWTVQCVDPITNSVAATCAVGDLVRVNATSQFTLITPVVSSAFGTVHVGSTSEQQILQ